MIKQVASIFWHSFPHKFRDKIDIFRRFGLWKKHKVIFIHVPKAAGVSVNKAIYGKPLGHFYAKDIKKTFPKTFNNIFTFSVVRNPIDRLYSAYNFSRKGGSSEMKMHNPEFYINNPDFITFERFVHNWLAFQALDKIDHVFRPQSLYLFDDHNNILVDRIYKLEEIERHYDEISKMLGKPFILGNDNKTMKKPISISTETEHCIYDLYQRDFELLGYPKLFD